MQFQTTRQQQRRCCTNVTVKSIVVRHFVFVMMISITILLLTVNKFHHNYVTSYMIVRPIVVPRSVQICSPICYRSNNIVSSTSSSSSLSQSLDDTNNDTNSINGLNGSTSISSSNDNNNESKDTIIARRIIVKGDVQGGYYRACVLNEAGKFRRLVGTMSPIDTSSDIAEIYVEGKQNMVEGFIRWCQRSKVGLNQIITVQNIYEEEPTGMYDDFYTQTTIQ